MSYFDLWSVTETGVRVPVGSSSPKEPPADDVERFLAMLRFDSREKLKELPNLNLDV